MAENPCRQTFTIEGRLDGTNEYTSACRGRRNYGAAMKRENQKKVVEAIRRTGLKPVPTPVNVYIDWYEQPNRGNLRDKDNIQFSVKFILDALVEAGIIIDDGFDHIGRIVPECYRTENDPRIIVTVEALA